MDLKQREQRFFRRRNGLRQRPDDLRGLHAVARLGCSFALGLIDPARQVIGIMSIGTVVVVFRLRPADQSLYLVHRRWPEQPIIP